MNRFSGHLSIFIVLATVLGDAANATMNAPEDGPKKTLGAMMAALAAHDSAALETLCDASNDSDRALVSATAKMLVAGRTLADAATKKFGEAGEMLGKGPIAKGDEKDISAANVTIAGDSAELLLPGHTLPLRFVQRDGVWKFKVNDFAGSQQRDLARQAALVDMFAGALSEATKEIEEDRYATAEAAQTAIRQKLNFVLMRSLAPATQPQ